MSLMFQMIAVNARLSDWESFKQDGRSSWSPKQPEKLAREIFSQLSHPKVVELVVAEYEDMPPQVRLELRELCNRGNASGNVRKNVQVLDQRLKGRLLASEKHVQFTSVRKERHNGVGYERHEVNPAIAGAKRKYRCHRCGHRCASPRCPATSTDGSPR